MRNPTMLDAFDDSPPKMGYETTPQRYESFGNAGWCVCDGRQVWTDSQAERDWLAELELCIRAGEVLEWEWQPGPYMVTHTHGRSSWTKKYTPDARVKWSDGRELWYEVKNSLIRQVDGHKIKAFCEQNPDKPLVLVWKGKPPQPATLKKQKRRKTTKTQWDKIVPHVHHVWYLR